MRVERVSKKFCRSLKRSLWYGIGDIAGELNPFAGGKGHGVEGGGKPLDVLQSTGAHGRSGQLAESHPQGSLLAGQERQHQFMCHRSGREGLRA